MARRLAVLLLDDGELDDVQEILQSLGVSFGRVRGGAIVNDQPPPTTLLVSTPRRIDAIGESAAEGDKGPGPVRVVVVNEDSPTLRAKLRAVGFDYIVRRPVHPEALRLLIMRCLYTGEERRREPRVPVGCELSFRTGLLYRRATVVELSTAGCRLLSRYALEPGKRIKLLLPEEMGAGEALSVSGRVIRTSFEEHTGAAGLYSAAVAFEKVPREVRQELEWIIEERTQGPVTLRRGEAHVRDPEAPETRHPETAPGARPTEPAAERPEPWPKEIRHRPRRPDPRAEEAEPQPDEAPAAAPAPAEERQPEAGPQEPRGMEIEVNVRMAEDLGAAPEKSSRSRRGFSDRRRNTRSSFERKVPAFGGRALRVLVGRDLSMGGMRVERFPELEIGDRLHLAIYGEAGTEPFLVWGTVNRDDGEEGMAIMFDEIHPTVGEQLDKLVASLPAVESLHDDEARAMGTVVTEILDG